jgi:hypothetical protein
MQSDRHGNRIWRDARALLDSEHAVGQEGISGGAQLDGFLADGRPLADMWLARQQQ